MNSLLSFGILLSLILGAGADFPCDKITNTGVEGFYCQDVGYCYRALDGSDGCLADTCMATTESESCPVGCTLRWMNSDHDCVTDTVVNKTDLFCSTNSHSSINDCFYKFLKTGTCGSGCKLVSLEGKGACIDDSPPLNHDPCNDYTTEHCEFYSPSCFLKDGVCVLDSCRYSQWWDDNAQKCSDSENCVASDVYEMDDQTGLYTLEKICSDPGHSYDKCSHIDISEIITTVGSCTETVFHPEVCTPYEGCKVLTLDGHSVCSSRDLPQPPPPPSSANTSRVPSIFAFLFIAVLTLTIFV